MEAINYICIMDEIKALERRIDIISQALSRQDSVIKAQNELILELERANDHAWNLIKEQRIKTEKQLIQTESMINEFTANVCEFFNRNGMKDQAKKFKTAIYGEGI